MVDNTIEETIGNVIRQIVLEKIIFYLVVPNDRKLNTVNGEEIRFDRKEYNRVIFHNVQNITTSKFSFNWLVDNTKYSEYIIYIDYNNGNTNVENVEINDYVRLTLNKGIDTPSSIINSNLGKTVAYAEIADISTETIGGVFYYKFKLYITEWNYTSNNAHLNTLTGINSFTDPTSIITFHKRPYADTQLNTIEQYVNSTLMVHGTVSYRDYRLKNGCILTLDEYNSLNYNYILIKIINVTSSGQIIEFQKYNNYDYNTYNDCDVYLSCGSGINGEGNIAGNKLTIIRKGIYYKKNDILVLIKKDIPSTLTFADDTHYILKRRYELAYGYKYDNGLKLVDLTQTDFFTLNLIKNIRLYFGYSNDKNISSIFSYINIILDSSLFRYIPFYKIVYSIASNNNEYRIFQNLLNEYKDDFNEDKFYYKNILLKLFNNVYDKYTSSSYDLYFNDDIKISISNEFNIEVDNIDNNLIKINKNTLNYEKIKDEEYKIINRKNKLEYSWIYNLGIFLFKNVRLYFNDCLIDEYYSDMYQIYSELIKYSGSIDGCNKLIGNVDKLITVNSKKKDKYKLIIPTLFWFSLYDDINIPIIALPYSKIKIEVLFEDIKNLIICDYNKDNLIFENTDKLNTNLITNLIYLEESERKLVANKRHEYLIEQYQYNGKYKIEDINNINININFSNCIKDMFYVINTNNKTQKVNYTLNETDIVNGGNPILSSSLTLSGQKRFNNLSGVYTNYIVPYEKYYSTPSDGINVFSFAEYPLLYQPSGCLNFSEINDIKLNLEIDKTKINVKDIYYVDVYARSYNILRIMSGMGEILF